MANLCKTSLSLPWRWLSGTPWSCRTCTASLQASGQHPGLTFSTDPLPSGQGANTKLEPPSSLGLLVPSELAWTAIKGPSRALKAVSQSTLPQGHLQSHPCSCHRPKCVFLPLLQGKPQEKKHPFMAKDKRRHVVPGTLHPILHSIRVTFK